MTCAPPVVIRERNLREKKKKRRKINKKKKKYFYRVSWKVKGITKLIAAIPFRHFLWKIVFTVEQLIYTAGLL